MDISQDASEENGDVGDEEFNNNTEEIKEENSPAQKKPYHYDPILPPCRICGTKATGYHFGVITCEACKIFFRRSLGRQKPYRCKGSGDCNVVPDRRLSCSYCRLQKCHRLGMSRDGIQRGRYTVEKKSRCILEVKQLQSQSPGTPHSNMTSDSPGSSENSNTEPNRLSSLAAEVNKAVLSSTCSAVKTEAGAINIYPSVDVNGIVSHTQGANMSASAAVTKLLQTASLDELANIITSADQKTLMVEPEQMKKLIVMRDSVDIGYLANTRSLAEMGSESSTEVDNRKHKFAKCIIGLVTDIKQFIKFAKLLPGFLDLCLEDQILLLREGMLDWVMLSSYEAVDSQSNVSICASCQTVYTMKDFQDIGDPGYYQQTLLAAKVLHRLQFYPEELAVFKALSIYSPDGSEGCLKEPEKVEDLQERMVDVLCYTIQKKRKLSEDSEAAVMLGRFIHTLTETRASSLRCKQLVDQCLIQLFPDIEYPELLLEMFGDERVNMLQSLRAANSNTENDMTNITEPLSPPPAGREPCNCDPANKEDFETSDKNLENRHQQIVLFDQNTPITNIAKMATDMSMSQYTESQNKPVGRPSPRKTSMLQTALLEDASCWDELWAKSSIDTELPDSSSKPDTTGCNKQCSTSCGGRSVDGKHVCVPPDVLKYLFARGLRPHDLDLSLQQKVEDELKIEGSDKLKSKKKHHECFPILPPCKVCGAKATGFHFGAITCDACQIFFRRSLERQKPYKCKGNGDCSVVPDRRLTCSYCRLQRCHQLGMSRDAIQRGRYTVERKTYCIQEAKLASEGTGSREAEPNNGAETADSPNRNELPNGENLRANDSPKTSVSPNHSGTALSSPAAENSIRYSGGVIMLENHLSTPGRTPGYETNQEQCKPAGSLSQSAGDTPVNDTNNNVMYSSYAARDVVGPQSKGSSSMEMVSNAFRVMNDIGHNPCDYAQSYPQGAGHLSTQQRPGVIQNTSEGDCFQPVEVQKRMGQGGAFTRDHDPMSCSPPTSNPQNFPSYGSITSSAFPNPPNSYPVSYSHTQASNIVNHSHSSTVQAMESSSFPSNHSPPFHQAPNIPVASVSSTQNYQAYPSIGTSTAMSMISEPVGHSGSVMAYNNSTVDSSTMSHHFSNENHQSMQDPIIHSSQQNQQYGLPSNQPDLSYHFSAAPSQPADDAASQSSVDSLQDRTPSLGELYDPEVEKLIEAVTKAHLATLMVTDENREALFRSQSKHIEYRKLRESVYGRMDPICPEQYKELYKKTGLDVDDRKSKISQCFLTQVTYVNKLAQFAQKIPGFSELILDDQITLLRGSAGDFMLFANLETFDCEHKVYTCSVCHANYDKEEFLAMGDMEFHDQWATAAQVLQKLELRDEEAALLKALSLFSPDGLVGLPRDAVFIHNMQMRVAEALCYVIRRQRDLHENRHVAIMFGRIVQALTELKHASLLGKRLIDRFIIEMFPDIEYPEVLMEIYGEEIRQKLHKLRASRGHSDNKDESPP